MTTAVAPRPNQQLAKHEQIRSLMTAPDRRERFTALMPDCYKAKADRWIQRGIFYIQSTAGKDNDVTHCTPESLIECLMRSAERGIPLDGRMGHAVKFGNVAVFMPDFKGLIAAAKRTGQILDATADTVHENDTFHHERNCDKDILQHSYPFGKPRGNRIGVYCRIILPTRDVRYVLLDNAEIETFKNASKMKSGGPWKFWPNEMAKKSAVRRALKMFIDDPDFQDLVGDDDDAIGVGDMPPPMPAKKVAVSNLGERLELPANGNGAHPTPPASQDAIDEPAPDETSQETPDEGGELPVSNAEVFQAALVKLEAAYAKCDTSDERSRLDESAFGEHGYDWPAADAEKIRGWSEMAKARERGTAKAKPAKSEQKTMV